MRVPSRPCKRAHAVRFAGISLIGVMTPYGANASRSAVTATAIAVSMLTLSACSDGHKQQAHRSGTVALRSVTQSAQPDDVLSLSGLGTFEGRCPRGARSWTLRFVVDVAAATDTVSYRVGAGAVRTVNINPGNALTFHLMPDATKTHEPADRFVPPPGQGRGLAMAMVVPTTAPLQVSIYQGTEPQTLRADVRLALATIGGESGQCVLVGSSVNAYTYPNSSP
jgi:hypothetical protein